MILITLTQDISSALKSYSLVKTISEKSTTDYRASLAKKRSNGTGTGNKYDGSMEPLMNHIVILFYRREATSMATVSIEICNMWDYLLHTKLMASILSYSKWLFIIYLFVQLLFYFRFLSWYTMNASLIFVFFLGLSMCNIFKNHFILFYKCCATW